MPLELSIFLGAKAFGSVDQRRKSCLILDADRYRYQKFISDIAGQDIRAHGRTPPQAIIEVRNFLQTHRDPALILPGGEAIERR